MEIILQAMSVQERSSTQYNSSDGEIEAALDQQQVLEFIDLFAGLGGFHLVVVA